jgi:hypothetical protein
MRNILVAACWLAAGAAAYAGDWEVGALGGWSYSPTGTVRAPAGNADAGLRQGGVIGVFGGHDTYRYWSGEARYLYRYSDLKLASGSTGVRFGGHTHIVHADFLGHFRPKETSFRPFVAFGGGIKMLVGTGTESAGQPLGNRAALTATREVLPVADVGAGFKWNLHRYVRLRLEFRDYISTRPGKVIAPAPGASFDGVMNDFIGTVGISLTW